jgi:hypothetical protein
VPQLVRADTQEVLGVLVHLGPGHGDEWLEQGIKGGSGAEDSRGDLVGEASVSVPEGVHREVQRVLESRTCPHTL